MRWPEGENTTARGWSSSRTKAGSRRSMGSISKTPLSVATATRSPHRVAARRSEEHTSELQSRSDLVCRLLLEKKTPSVSYWLYLYPCVSYAFFIYTDSLLT